MASDLSSVESVRIVEQSPLDVRTPPPGERLSVQRGRDVIEVADDCLATFYIGKHCATTRD
jgi:hypothetical protein